jgi:hypothetical protein
MTRLSVHRLAGDWLLFIFFAGVFAAIISHA